MKYNHDIFIQIFCPPLDIYSQIISLQSEIIHSIYTLLYKERIGQRDNKK